MKNWPFIIMVFAWLVSQYLIYNQKETIKDLKQITIEKEQLIEKSDIAITALAKTVTEFPKTIVRAYLVGVSDAEQCIVNKNLEKCYKVNEVTIRYGELND
jgi:hypothetical protein